MSSLGTPSSFAEFSVLAYRALTPFCLAPQLALLSAGNASPLLALINPEPLTAIRGCYAPRA